MVSSVSQFGVTNRNISSVVCLTLTPCFHYWVIGEIASHVWICWFTHYVIKNSKERIIDPPEFLLSWIIKADKSQYSEKISLRKKFFVLWYSTLKFPSFCVTRHLHGSYCEQALRGALWGGERKESSQLRLWNLNSTSNSPVAARWLSCQIFANQREAETNAIVNKHWKTRAKGNGVITNVISANQYFASTYSFSRDVAASSPSLSRPAARAP